MRNARAREDLAAVFGRFAVDAHGGNTFARLRDRAFSAGSHDPGYDATDDPLEAPLADAWAFSRGTPADGRPGPGRRFLAAAVLDAARLARRAPYEAAVLGLTRRLGEFTYAAPAETAAAYVVGCETALRLRRGMGDASVASTWDDANLFGLLGATAAAARLFHLDATRAGHAIGIAATQCSGLHAVLGTEAAHLGIGKSAADAFEAALFARGGVRADPAALEGPLGFASVLTRRYERDLMLADLGTRWMIEERSV